MGLDVKRALDPEEELSPEALRKQGESTAWRASSSLMSKPPELEDPSVSSPAFAMETPSKARHMAAVRGVTIVALLFFIAGRGGGRLTTGAALVSELERPGLRPGGSGGRRGACSEDDTCC